ncbi:hypothetical protein DPMN_164930 [Dreissena polymorpha]|uniref:Uncharacterized protein n=1 Tax=Dreissena polymorpha TaxID=45954 RepID=A0A9D4ISR7_DREPO|nr:hypothetical protein DPMN_164896 [Dreissena polymorpha]KAH3786819.1 hypothetical protein DPMN_164930 [Dreissena polymorpha]
MTICAEKTNLITSNIDGTSNGIGVCDEKQETVNSFKYLGAAVMDTGSMSEILASVTHPQQRSKHVLPSGRSDT